MNEIDITRDVCPLTTVRVSQALSKMPGGARLRVTLRLPALKNVMSYLKTHGHPIIDVERGDDRIVLDVLKAGPPPV